MSAESGCARSRPAAVRPCAAWDVTSSLVSYTFPGIDTTVNALATAVVLFARHPEQWDTLRADRSLIPAAFNEVLRLHGPVHHFTRYLTEDVEIESLTLLARDADSGDVRIRQPWTSAASTIRTGSTSTGTPAGHVGFGKGIHLLRGHPPRPPRGPRPRSRRWPTGSPASSWPGTVRWQVNNTLHGPAEAPVRQITGLHNPLFVLTTHPLTLRKYPPTARAAVLRSTRGVKVLLEGAIDGTDRVDRAVEHRAGPTGVGGAHRTASGPAGPMPSGGSCRSSPRRLTRRSPGVRWMPPGR